jgi:hypothetical protein
LAAGGAIMRYPVTAHGNGFNVPMVGDILMIVGLVGAAVTLAVFAARGAARPSREREARSL